MLESINISPWNLFMMISIMVAVVACILMTRSNRKLKEKIDKRIAIKKAADTGSKFSQTANDGKQPAHG